MHNEFDTEEITKEIDMKSTPDTKPKGRFLPGYEVLSPKEKEFVQKLVHEFNKFRDKRHEGSWDFKSSSEYTGSYFAYSRKFLGEDYVGVTIEFKRPDFSLLKARADAAGMTLTDYVYSLCIGVK